MSFVITIFLLDLDIIFSIKLDRLAPYLTTRLFRKYLNNNQEGFTLVELIVVVVIIGVLSSIVVPSFQNSSKKARQKGAGAQVATYIKAAQMFFTEYGTPVNNAGDLGIYINVVECRYHLISHCKNTNNQRDVAVSQSNSRAWNSTSGMYTLTMRSSDNSRFRLNALPQRQDMGLAQAYSNTDYGVSGCYNYNTGVTKVIFWDIPGYKEVKNLNCWKISGEYMILNLKNIQMTYIQKYVIDTKSLNDFMYMD